MKLVSTVCASLVTMTLIGSSALAAEHQMEGQKPMGCQMGQQGESGAQPPMMGRGMMGQGMMGMPMMEMGCPMMRQMMCGMMAPEGMGMMGMMRGGKDPKRMGRMLQMRGDIMKAVGEVMLKYGKEIAEEAK
jgi:hypothetical protein